MKKPAFAFALCFVFSILGLFSAKPVFADSYAEQVQEMYVAYYGRPGDPGGVAYWADRLRSANGDLTAIIDAFGNSEEFQTRYGGQSNRSLVSNIYKQLLSRDADNEGLNFYVNKLDTGELSLGSIALDISNGVRSGSQDYDVVNNKLTLANAFTQSVSEGVLVYGNEEISTAKWLLSKVESSGDSFQSASETLDVLKSGYLIGEFGGVSGAGYATTSGYIGKTDEDGLFYYKSDDRVNFFHDLLTFGEVKGKQRVSVFSFLNPSMVAQSLYALDVDGNPRNGIVLPDPNSAASDGFAPPPLQAPPVALNLDHLSSETESYRTLLDSYGAELVSRDEAINTELYAELRSVDPSPHKDRFLQYVAGDFTIAPGSRFNHDLVWASQEDVVKRIYRAAYVNNLMIMRSALATSRGKDIAEIEEMYKGYLEYTADQLKKVERARAFLTSLGDLKQFVKTSGYEAVKYAIEEKVSEAKSALGEGVYSEVLDAQAKALLGCIEIYENNGLANCAVSFTHAQINTIIATSLENDPVYKELAYGLTDVAADTTSVYITCKELFALKDVGLDTLTNCLSKPLEITYKNLTKIIASTNGLLAIARTEKEFVSKDVAYAVAEIYSYLGSYGGVARFLSVEGDYSVAGTLEGLDVLLQAEYEYQYGQERPAIDMAVARETLIELVKKIRGYYTHYKSASDYAFLFQYDASGRVVSLSDEYRRNYYSRSVSTELTDVQLVTELDSQYVLLRVCFRLKNYGDRDVVVKPRDITIENDVGRAVVDIDGQYTLSMGNPFHQVDACEIGRVHGSELPILEEDFLLNIEMGYRPRVRATLGESLTISDYILYEGLDIRGAIPPTLRLVEEDQGDGFYTISAFVEEQVYYPHQGYLYDWGFHGGHGSSSFPHSKASFLLTGEKGKVELVLRDADGKELARNGISLTAEANPEPEVQPVPEPLGVGAIYKEVVAGGEFVLHPVVSGGVPPYRVLFDEAGLSGFDISSLTDREIQLVALPAAGGVVRHQIDYQVVDERGDGVAGSAFVDVVQPEKAKVGFITRMDLPRTTVDSPGVLGLGDEVVKEWGLINTSHDMEGARLVWSNSSSSSLSHDRGDIVLGDWASGEIRKISVPLRRNVGSSEVDTGAWHLYHEATTGREPVYYDVSGIHAYIDYSFVTESTSPPVFYGRVSAEPTGNALALSWNEAITGGDWYEVHKSEEDGVLGEMIYSGERTDYIDENVVPGFDYYYTPSACNSEGCVKGEQALGKINGVVTAVPSLNGGVAISNGPGGFNLRWNAASGTVTHYELYRSTEAGVLGLKVYAGLGVSSFDGGLVSGVRYFYTARACNGSACVQSNQDFSDYIATAPDLAVSVSTVKSVYVVGETMRVDAAIRNEGDADAPASQLTYYLSADATITPDDAPFGSDAVAVVAAGATVGEVLTQHVNVAHSGFYLGACVAPVAGESDTSNNCSTGKRIVFVEDTAPDLSVSVSTSKSTYTVGESMRVDATVHNQGDAESAASQLTYYISSDETITTSDSAFGSDSISAIVAGGSVNETKTSSVSGAHAGFYVGACVSIVEDESDTSNNCSAGKRIVFVDDTAPDLTVSVSTAKSTYTVGESMRVDASIHNAGNAESPAAQLTYYLSTDPTITPDDAEFGSDAVPLVAAGATVGEVLTRQVTGAHTGFYLGACIAVVEDERDTSNNCSAGQRIVFIDESAPDLTVSVATAKSTYTVGESLRVDATIRNQGDAEAPASQLTYYLSTDATITPDDAQFGSDAVPVVAAGAAVSEALTQQVTGANSGFYLGACVSVVEDESNTINNCSVGKRIVFVEDTAPDLTVSVSTAKSTYTVGESMRVDATIRNQGDAEAPASQLTYYISSDATITPSDTEFGTDSVSALVAGASVSETKTSSVAVAHSGFYLGACVAPVEGESDTSNNCSAGKRIVFEEDTAPDLTVSVSTAKSTYTVGESMRVDATIRNQGDAEAPASQLTYYISSDATITPSDTEFGTDSVGALVAGASASETKTSSVAVAHSGFYLGACVAPVEGESDTSNNCSAGKRIVFEEDTAPDLTVSVSTAKSIYTVGESMRVDATIRNQGDAEAPASQLTYYISSDATITPSDTEFGTDSVSALVAGASASETKTSSVTVAHSGFYLGACVAPVEGESDTSNNCSAGKRIVFEENTEPDLMVSVSTAKSTYTVGESMRVDATVRNQGDADAPASQLTYYISSDATITPSDTEFGTDSVSALVAGASASESKTSSVAVAHSGFYLGACVAPVDGESDTSNNCSAGKRIVFEEDTAPDLTVSVSTAKSTYTVGENMRVDATIRNQGDAEAPASQLTYYISSDATITPSDTEFGTDSVNALVAGASASETKTSSVAVAHSGFYLGACVAPVDGESDTSNNCSAGKRIVFEEDTAPDLTVSVSTAKSTYTVGESMRVDATIRNQGDAEAPASQLTYYLSTDATISPADTEFGNDAVAAIAAGASVGEVLTKQVTGAHAGFYLGACVSSVEDESDTSNNCSTGKRIVFVDDTAPDLTVSVSTAKSTYTVGESMRVDATVRNEGDAEAPASQLTYYLSTDATISPADTEFGTDAVAVVAAGAAVGEVLTKQVTGTHTGFYLGACVSAVEDESDTSNNCSAGKRITFVDNSAPDLTVSVSTAKSTYAVGEIFRVDATIRNEGDASSSSTQLKYYISTNATITTSDSEFGSDAVSAIAAGSSAAENISQSVTGTNAGFYVGACVVAVSGESDTTNNCSAGKQITFVDNSAPDLTVSVSTAKSTYSVGETFRVDATIRNEGDASSSSTQLKYYISSNATITTSDSEFGSDAVSAIAAGSSAAENISQSVTGTNAGFYVGACVVAVSGESDTTNNCSAGKQITFVDNSAPDLTVSVSTAKSTYSVGETFRVDATIRNEGDASSSSTQLKYYISTNATITTSDSEFGSDAVSAIAAGSSAAENISQSVTGTNAGFYVGACVVAVSGESDTTNNCSAGKLITFVDNSAPDLTVSVSTAKSTYSVGETFRVDATIRNEGDASSSSTQLKYYISTNATITTSDTEFGSDAVSAISAGSSAGESISQSVTGANSGFYVGACVVSVSGESNTSNNCSAGKHITFVDNTAPDLTVSISTAKSTYSVGETFRVDATIRNEGDASSSSTQLKYYISTNATITTSDTEFGSDAVSAISAGSSAGESISQSVTGANSGFYVGACVVSVSGESNTSNNCSAGKHITFVDNTAPDLTVSISTAKSTYSVGETFRVDATIRNQGDASSSSTELKYYISTNSTITTSDSQFGSDTVSSISAGSSTNESIAQSVNGTHSGFYVGACVVAVSGESDTGNNCSSGKRITFVE